MTIEITAAEAGANILAHVEARTLMQGIWHDSHGRGIACLLSAIHEDIGAAQDCPASLMPQWLAGCTPTLFDGIAQGDIYQIARRYGRLVANGAMGRANDAACTRWLAGVVELARAAAESASRDLACWPAVDAACHQTMAALLSKDNRRTTAAKAWKSAEAAEREAAAAGTVDAVAAEAMVVAARNAAAVAREAAATGRETAAAAVWKAVAAARTVEAVAAVWAAAAVVTTARAGKPVTAAAAAAVVASEAVYLKMFNSLLDEIEATEFAESGA